MAALDKLCVGSGCRSFLDAGCGTGYVAALAACLLGGGEQVGTGGAACLLGVGEQVGVGVPPHVA